MPIRRVTHKGQTNRDRGRLTNAKQEAEQIARIWSAVFGRKSSVVEQDELLDKYLTLLQDCGCAFADVQLARYYLFEEAATKLWKRLITRSVEGAQGTPKDFYYDEAQGGDVSPSSSFQRRDHANNMRTTGRQ